jgi:hypothetical protein
VADALTLFLSALATLDPRLTGWRLKGGSRRSAISQPSLSLAASSLAELLRIQKTDVGGEAMPQLGYSFSAWNGRRDDDAASVSCTAGLHAGNPHLRNSVALTVPDDLVQGPVLERLDAALRESWDPDEVVLRSLETVVLWVRG